MAIDYEGAFDFARVIARFEFLRQDALAAGMEIVKADAVERVPKLSDHLADSAEIVRGAGGPDSVGLLFPGPYAKVQHERLDYDHPHGGEPKFEENALKAKKDEALAEVARVLKEGLSS